MTEILTSQVRLSPGRNPDSRVLDTAVGILVGWRRCGTYTAFRELISVSERHRVPIFALAGALVSLASRDGDVRGDTAAELAAEREWGLTYLL
ncbi:ANTAR domain-containing protein [Mycobacterium sp. Aquia_216]|uniref:ANTAR domain-containing protein n=1 Tax=Mycobacterium sp. Aquia_216 TaxID=2991729 RepID=UPI00227BBCF3|nr:ANTAR domain-containing protein [Mycobacterium sp. Aquia_216]WAJ43580.1 ANTAR domain-containing protein [Mycobacterium sp. Aquia_216]